MRAPVTRRTQSPRDSSDSPGRNAEPSPPLQGWQRAFARRAALHSATEDRVVVERVIWRGILTLTLLPFFLVGCSEPKVVWLELPSFSAIDGVWFWRRSEATDTYQRACRIELADPETVNGQAIVDYIQECDDGQSGVPLSAAVERTRLRNTVRLGLWYSASEGPGVYRVSSYGKRGESALSATPFDL